MATALGDFALAAALRAAREQRQPTYEGARLIHHYSNAVCWLPGVDAIARIATDSEHPERLVRRLDPAALPLPVITCGRPCR